MRKASCVFFFCTEHSKSDCQGRRWEFDPLVEIPWRRAWQPTPVFLPRESHGQRSLAGYSPCGRRVRHTEQVSTVQQVSQLIWLCSPQPTAPKPVLSLCHPPLPHLPSFPFPSICLPSFLLILLFWLPIAKNLLQGMETFKWHHI